MAIGRSPFGYDTPPGGGRYPRDVFELRIETGPSPSDPMGQYVLFEWYSHRCQVGQRLQLRPEWGYNRDAVHRLADYVEGMVGGQLAVMVETMHDPRDAAAAIAEYWEREIYFQMERIERERMQVSLNRMMDAAAMVDWPHFAFTPPKEDKEAKKRATELLLKNLDERQRRDFTTHKQFTMTGKDGKQYIITSARSFNVQGPDGKKYCGQLVDTPIEDQMLAQKLLLEHEPEKFFKNANVSGGGGTYAEIAMLQNQALLQMEAMRGQVQRGLNEQLRQLVDRMPFGRPPTGSERG